jgi:hypothetical protein
MTVEISEKWSRLVLCSLSCLTEWQASWLGSESCVSKFEHAYVTCQGLTGGGVCEVMPCNRPWGPIELWDVKAPTFSRQSTHRWGWGFQPYALTALPPGRILVLICFRGWVYPKVIVQLEGLGTLKTNPVTSSGIETVIIWVVAHCFNTTAWILKLQPCSWTDGYQCFGRTAFLHLQVYFKEEGCRFHQNTGTFLPSWN